MKSIKFESAQNVKVEYEFASPIQRVTAALIDGIAIGVYIFLLLIVLGSSGVKEFMLLEIFLIKIPWILYHPIMEYLTYGQTLGKYLLGIRVVSVNGERPGLKEIFTRWIFKGYFLWIGFSFQSFLFGTPELLMMGMIQICIGFIGFIYCSISSNRQRMGDVMAITVVVRNKSSIKYTLKDVLSIKTQSNYEPSYPNAIRFTDEDMLLIKTTINRVRTHPSPETKKMAIELAEKSARLLDLEETPEKRLQFLQTLLQDYVVLTR